MDTCEEPLFRYALGDAIKWHRQRRALTLREACTEAGVSIAHWSEVERGRKEVSSELLKAMCASLGVPVGNVVKRALSVMHVAAEPDVAPFRARAPHRGQPPRDPLVRHRRRRDCAARDGAPARAAGPRLGSGG